MNASLGRPWIIRHHTAIILIVWYLMLPPLLTRSGVLFMKPNDAAALTEWRPMQLENGATLIQSVAARIFVRRWHQTEELAP